MNFEESVEEHSRQEILGWKMMVLMKRLQRKVARPQPEEPARDSEEGRKVKKKKEEANKIP